MKHDLARRSVQAVFWSYLGAGGKIAAQLVIQILLARMLGPSVFGQYAAVLVVIGFGWLFADSGFGAALVQKKDIDDNDVGYALGWVLLLSVVTGAAIMGLSPWLAKALGDSALMFPLLVCGPIIVLQALSNISTSLMRRNLDMKRSQIIQLIAYVVGFGVVAVVLAQQGAGVWSLVIGFLVQTLISLIAGYWVVRHTLVPRLEGDAGLRKFGFSVLGTNLANWAIDNLDRFLIGRQWGIAALGAYSAASNLSRVPVTLLVSSFQSVVLSSASRVQDDHDRLRRGFSAVLSLVSVVTFPLAAVLALKADFVIHTLYGDQWEQAGMLFAAFCVALPSYVLLSVTGPTLWAVGAAASEFKVQLFTAFVLLTGLLLLAGQPLAAAIWLIPCVYLFRFLLVYRVLGQRIGLANRQTLQAITGGLVLTAIVICIELATTQLAPNLSNPLLLNAAQGALHAIACLTILRLAPRFFMGTELCTMLVNRRAESKVARVACQIISLKAPAP